VTGTDWASLKTWILEQGPAQIAAGDVRDIKSDFELASMQDLSGLDRAISLAWPLPRETLMGIVDRPTLLYKHAYTQINYLMDRTATLIALKLQEAGARALPIPASHIIEWEYPLKAHVNHRQVAAHLGQGWFGRNNLLVTPDCGAKVRLVTVLTDAEISEPGPWSEKIGGNGCGKCVACVKVCPAGAIRHGPQDFDLKPCAEKNREFEKIRGIGQRICGICVKACDGPDGAP